MSTQFSISTPEEKDVNVLGDLLLRSKLALSINRLLWTDWPNETAQRKQYTSAIAGALKDPNMQDLKAVDDQTGHIVGYICFTKKKGNAQSEVKNDVQPQAKDDGVASAASRQPPAGMSAEVLAGVGKACQEVVSGFDFPDNYGRLSRTIGKLDGAYFDRSHLHRRRPAISWQRSWITTSPACFRGGQSSENPVLCVLGARSATVL